ncbi:HNH endonuclease signature motif containing protein [Methylorubrum thiocyanatum]|uniref:HNH endonuclease signature motif containing protein n=1 Tax=Methylorubrum thiocyanatum TaxID=47958 RepID=UPI0035C86ECD
MPFSQDTLARFWAKVDVRGPDECWLWTAGTDRAGYGKLKAEGRDVGAHRISWEVANGPIPAGRLLRHGCDTPACCNPGHFTPGTHAQNLVDSVERGRRPGLRGRHPRAKLTQAQVDEIRASSLPGWCSRGSSGCRSRR